MDREPAYQPVCSHIDRRNASDEEDIGDLEGRQINEDDVDETGEEYEEADEEHRGAGDEAVFGAAYLYDEMSISDRSIVGSIELDTNRHNQASTEPPIDHTTDMQNGHFSTGAAASTGGEDSGSEQSSMNLEARAQNGNDEPSHLATEGQFVQESAHPSQSSPLLICGTKSDLLLLDPSNKESPVVDKIEYVISRTPMPTLMEMLAFDRITFLEWVPELAVVVVGSLTSTVAIVRLECAQSDAGSPRYKMRVLAHIPVKTRSSPLYGVSVYRNPVDCSQFCTITLYLLYSDGDLAAHEMRLPSEQAGSLPHFSN
ncbi:hypothetical protein LPJ81_004706 [Coemansia sp. IMI 209127]|nr:hypothetical protein LPJ81_004706 [Coemansia sp. IMI 209127]